MTTANLSLPNGTKVVIEGTADEVATLLSRFTGDEILAPARRARRGPKPSTSSAGTKRARGSIGPRGLIEELARSGYFKAQKRTIGDVQKKLEEDGHIYAMPSLSPALLRLVRARVLRRIKENKAWLYVQ